MIKRFGKKKVSKKGSILVVVVLILALAMIFITAAMMLTQATRVRLYEKTMGSQARLTVTSASEVFLEALQTQEITDDQINTLLKKKSTMSTDNSTKIRMVVEGVPGMAPSSSDPDDKNCTYLDIYYPVATDKTKVYCDFSTTIGDNTENVRIELKYEPTTSPKYGNRFENEIDTSQYSDYETLRFTGGIGIVTNGSNPLDNTILFRNGNLEHASGGKYQSTLVYAPGATARFGSATYYGDLVFLEGATFRSDAAAVSNITSDMYFFGTDNGAAFVYDRDNVWDQVKSTNFVFAGRTAQNDPSADNAGKIEKFLTATDAKCYFISVNKSDGSSTEIITTSYDSHNASNYNNSYTIPNAGGYSAMDEDMQSAYDTYKDYDYSETSDPFPSSLSSVFADMKPSGTATAGSAEVLPYDTWSVSGTPYSAGTTIPEGTEYVVEPLTATYPSYKMVEGAVPTDRIIDIGNLSSYDKNGDKIIDIETEINGAGVDGGYFLIKSSTSYGVYEWSNDCTPYVIAIDASHGNQYRFYFDGTTINLRCVVFAMYNLGASKNPSPCYFILQPGANLVAADAQFYDSNKGSGLAGSGFLSLDRGYTTGAGIGKYVQDHFMTTLPANGGEYDSSTGYSTYYDNERKPMMFIFGEGSGTSFQFGSGSILEAYLGLYNGGAVDYQTDMHNSVWIYGRIEAYTINKKNTTGNFYMPYCPKPSESTTEKKKRLAETDYKVVNIIYYY